MEGKIVSLQSVLFSKNEVMSMVQIDDVVISLDVFREKFLCNLDACKGECCIEGDAGAPVELEEVEKLEEVLPVIWNELSPETWLHQS